MAITGMIREPPRSAKTVQKQSGKYLFWLKGSNYFETSLPWAAINQSYFETFLPRAAINQSYFETLLPWAAINQSYFETFLPRAATNQSKNVKNTQPFNLKPMINSIVLQPLRNGEYIQFLTDTLNIVSKNNPKKLNVSAQYDALLAAKDDIEKLFKISQASLITAEIEALDKRRDDAINGISLQVQSLSYSADAILNKHGKTLSAHLALFGTSIAKENYQSETTILRNIVNDWKNKPELQEAVTALNLGNWLTELETANNDFSTAYTKRNEELATAPTEKLKELRNKANELYYKLRTRINSNLDINDGAEPWAATVNLLNQNISTYTLLQTRRAAGKGEEPTVG